MGVLLNHISERVGFRVSFNRLRKYEFTVMKRRKVDPWVILYLHGGSDFKVLEHYLGPVLPEEAADEMAAKLWASPGARDDVARRSATAAA